MPFRSARQQEGEGARGGWVQAFAFLGFLWVVGFQVGVSCGTARMVRDVVEYARIIEDVGGWFERRGIRNSVIFLTPSKEDKNTNAQKIFLRVRNEPDFSDTNLTASDRGPENGRLMAYYPGRRYFLYEIDIDRLVRGEEMNWREIYRREYPEPSSLGLGP